MKLIKNKDNEFTLCYKYKIITNRNNKYNGKTYYFYTTHFPSELAEYLGTDEYWVYQSNNKIYLTTEEPIEFSSCKKMKARDKYKTGDIKVIPLNPKIFNLIGDVTDKYLQISVHLNQKDLVTDEILIELTILK